MTRPSEFFDHAFLERQQAVYPHLDVHIYAAAAREFCGRHPIRNPNGLLVHWLKRADTVYREQVANRSRDTAAELELYADLWTALLRAAVEQQLGPAAFGRALDEARRCGFTKLNGRLIGRLQEMGERWPEDPRQSALTGPARTLARKAARPGRS